MERHNDHFAHTHIHSHIHAHAHTYMHTHIHRQTKKNSTPLMQKLVAWLAKQYVVHDVRARIHARVGIGTYSHTYTRTHVRERNFTQDIRTHALMHVYTSAYACVHTRTYNTQIQTIVQVRMYTQAHLQRDQNEPDAPCADPSLQQSATRRDPPFWVKQYPRPSAAFLRCSLQL